MTKYHACPPQEWTTHAPPEQLCIPHYSNHFTPPQCNLLCTYGATSVCTWKATMHAPTDLYAERCPASGVTLRMPPSNVHACPPRATLVAPPSNHAFTEIKNNFMPPRLTTNVTPCTVNWVMRKLKCRSNSYLAPNFICGR